MRLHSTQTVSQQNSPDLRDCVTAVYPSSVRVICVGFAYPGGIALPYLGGETFVDSIHTQRGAVLIILEMQIIDPAAATGLTTSIKVQKFEVLLPAESKVLQPMYVLPFATDGSCYALV